MFNTTKTAVNTNSGVRAWISTANPVIQGASGSGFDWVYARIYIQKIVPGSAPAFCEIGHMAKTNGYHYVYATYRVPGGQPQPANIPIIQLSPGIGHSYEVRLNTSNICSIYYDGVLLSNEQYSCA